jgi:hypothetical protein
MIMVQLLDALINTPHRTPHVFTQQNYNLGFFFSENCIWPKSRQSLPGYDLTFYNRGYNRFSNPFSLPPFHFLILPQYPP